MWTCSTNPGVTKYRGIDVICPRCGANGKKADGVGDDWDGSDVLLCFPTRAFELIEFGCEKLITDDIRSRWLPITVEVLALGITINPPHRGSKMVRILLYEEAFMRESMLPDDALSWCRYMVGTDRRRLSSWHSKTRVTFWRNC